MGISKFDAELINQTLDYIGGEIGRRADRRSEVNLKFASDLMNEVNTDLTNKTLLAEGAGERAYYGDEISADVPYEGYSDYRLDAPEIEVLGARGTISEEDYTNQYYMAGFDEGNRGQEDAMNMMMADQKLQQSTLALNSGKLDFAKKANDESIVSIGAVISNNMIATGVPEALGLRNILGVEGGSTQFASAIQAIIKQGEFPNIQKELVAALNDFANPQLAPADQLRGFTVMSGNAHEAMQAVNAIEAQAISSGFFGANVDVLAGLTDDQINQLRSSNELYDNAYAKILEYASAGIPVNNQKLLQQTYMSNQISSNIISSKNKIVSGEMDKLSQDLGISSDYLYENTEWIPEQNWDVTAAQLQAQEAEEAALQEGGLVLPEGLSEDWTEIVQLGEEMKVRREGVEETSSNIQSTLISLAQSQPFKKVMSDAGNQFGVVPNKELLDKIKLALERDIKKWLDPTTQKPWANIPVLGLLAPEQGVEGIVDNTAYVSELQSLWSTLVANWERHQELTGGTKKELSDRYKQLFISQ